MAIYVWECSKCKENMLVERPIRDFALPPKDKCSCAEDAEWIKILTPTPQLGPKFKGRWGSV